MSKGEKCVLRCAPDYAYGENGSGAKIPPNSSLDFEVELIDYDDWTQLPGESTIYKRIINEAVGDESAITEDSSLTLSWNGYYFNVNADGKSKEMFDNGENITIIYNDDDRFCDAFHKALESMQSMERAQFKVIDASLAYGLYCSYV